jgi:hypothetical protein
MSLGPKTVTFVTLTDSGTPGKLGTVTQVLTEVAIEGCMHHPLSASETPAWLTDIGTQIWQTIAPPEAAAIAANSTGNLKVDGVTYQIVGGAQPYTDFATPFVVVIHSKIENA